MNKYIKSIKNIYSKAEEEGYSSRNKEEVIKRVEEKNDIIGFYLDKLPEEDRRSNDVEDRKYLFARLYQENINYSVLFDVLVKEG